jgi:ubiquinone/menaquinone biosynthesis C-methylase UbiE
MTIPTQQAIWEQEHSQPTVLPQMDSHTVSSGVELFWQWLTVHPQYPITTGLEIGCGKGRNAIWLAQQGVRMRGYDFSLTAITEAKRRASALDCQNIRFERHDITLAFPLPSASINIAIDCFASTDIDNLPGRRAARDEIQRVLIPGGLLFVYSLSTQDSYHQALCHTSPAAEANAFVHPHTGKFEKIFSKAEILAFYQPFSLVDYRVVDKQAIFNHQPYACHHHWLVLQKI